jgi:hypothetical protein
MSSVNLDWTSAEVKDATLTVGLDREPPDGWKQSFERTVKLLGDGEWGDVALKTGSVRVSDITPGSEDKLRHHLEAIIAQANAAHEEDRSDEDGDDPEGPDAEMTERFKAFAEDDEAEAGA